MEKTAQTWTASAANSSGLTIKQLYRDMNAALFGVQIEESEAAVEIKRHPVMPKTRNRRIRAKWRKRYGLIEVRKPAMFKLKNPFTGEDYYIAHPDIVASLRRQILKSPLRSLETKE